MNEVFERAARCTPSAGMAMIGFTVMCAAAARAAAAVEDLAACQEAAGARLPRSFVSGDAMHWTPPADGEGVPPCLA